MKLLNTYESKDEAEDALSKISGDKRLASERDGTVIIYNLFGLPTWGNFYKLGMFELPVLQKIIMARQIGEYYNKKKHEEILVSLKYISDIYEIKIPKHWFLD